MTVYSLGEFRRFRGQSADFLYLVPSGGIFSLDEASAAILDKLSDGPLSRTDLIGSVSQKIGYSPLDVTETVQELSQVHAIRDGSPISTAPQQLPEHFPLQTLVMNLTINAIFPASIAMSSAKTKSLLQKAKRNSWIGRPRSPRWTIC